MVNSARGRLYWLRFAGIALLAVAIAEGFLNLVLSPTMEKSLWFTGKIHQPDEKFGFRFSPNYHGWMRFPEGVFLERLVLDEYGDRLPAERPASEMDVVLIGGYSMTFSYGVVDEHSIHHVLCDKLKTPTRVRNTAWPGFDPVRNLQIYKDQVGNGRRADVAVVFFFNENLTVFAGLPDPSMEFEDPHVDQDLFSFFGHHALKHPVVKLQQKLGSYYYHSIIIHKLGDGLRLLEKFYLDRRSKSVNAKAKGQGAPLPDIEVLGRERVQQFANNLFSYFGGAEHVLFVCLPTNNDVEHYTPIMEALPQGSHWVDLNRTEMDTVDVLGTMAKGHYTAASCEYLGNRIAKELDPITERISKHE